MKLIRKSVTNLFTFSPQLLLLMNQIKYPCNRLPKLLLMLLFYVVVSTFVIQVKAQQVLDIPNLIPYKDGELWGYKNTNNQIVIQAQYESAPFFNNGKAFVNWISDKITYCGLIDEKGTPLKGLTYELVQNLYSTSIISRGPHRKLDPKACAYVIKDNGRNNNNKGVIDRYGNEILPPNFDTITFKWIQNNNSLGCFEVGKIINNTTLKAIYSNEGKLMSPFVNLEDANFTAQLKPGFFRDSKNRIIDSSGTIYEVPFIAGEGFSKHPAHRYHILIYNKKPSRECGIYDLREKKILFSIKYRNIKSFGDGFTTLDVTNPKNGWDDQLLYNKSFKLIDTLNNNNAITQFHGNFFLNTKGQVFNKFYQCIFEFEDWSQIRIDNYTSSGLFYIIKYKQNMAMLIDSNGILKAQSEMPTYGLEKNSDIRYYLNQQIRYEKDIKKCIAYFKLLYTPIQKTESRHRGEISLDGATCFFMYEGKLMVEKTELAQKYIFVGHYQHISSFYTFNYTPIEPNMDLTFKFVIGNMNMFGSISLATDMYYKVNLDGTCEKASAIEMQLINESSNIKNPEQAYYSNCEDCPPIQKPLGNHRWNYASHTNSTFDIPLPTLVPQANSSSISFSDDDVVFFNGDTRVVFEPKGLPRKTYLGATPYYNLFAVYHKKKGLQGYIINDLAGQNKKFTMGYFW